MFEQIGTVLERVLEEKRARVPVRGHSYERGRCEGRFCRKTSRQEVRRILFAAKRYERIERRPGRRCGPLGSVAIEVLEYFVNLVDFRTGRLEPSIDTLMRRLKRSRDAIVRALRNLRTHGFLDWLRRYTPTGNDGRGPQVRQASNAYRYRNARNSFSAGGVVPSRFPKTASTHWRFAKRNWQPTRNRYPTKN